LVGSTSFDALYIAYGIGAAVLAAVAIPALHGASAAEPAGAVAEVA